MTHVPKVKECPQILFWLGSRILYREKGKTDLALLRVMWSMVSLYIGFFFPMASCNWQWSLQSFTQQMSCSEWLHTSITKQKDLHGSIRMLYLVISIKLVSNLNFQRKKYFVLVFCHSFSPLGQLSLYTIVFSHLYIDCSTLACI